MTKQKHFRNFLKKEKLKYHIDLSVQTLYSVPLAVITASSLLGYDVTSFAHLDFLPLFSADPLKLCKVGWGTSVNSHFQGSLEMFNWIHARALAGPLKDIHPLLHCLGCVLRVIVLLVNLRSSLRSWALRTRFSLRIALCFAPFSFPSTLTSPQVPAAKKHPHSMMLPPPCFTIGIVLCRWWAVPGFLLIWHLELWPNSLILVSSDQRILFVTVWESFRCFFANFKRVFYVSLENPDRWTVAVMVVLLGASPISTQDLWISQSDQRVLCHLSYQLPHSVRQWGQLQEESWLLLFFFHLRIMEATLLLRTFNAAEMFL